VDINILSGTIESIQDQPVGKLVVEIELEASPNTSKKIKAIIEALHAENVVVETISEVLS
jgi:ABC-type methionine transport system ATPase subunit